MSGFWNWWVAVLTAANVAFVLWLFLGSERRKSGEQQPGAAERRHDQHLDGDQNAEPGYRVDEAEHHGIKRACDPP